ncbi:hypothetical protein PR202_ga09216 [Eleusine coracana subsp. coracana]|uniref:Uncharacterized protein n=1 Tax=Eleusine coracana subsp. coracana TaxID=191504 RepID=A0AAV5C4K7_ELECO|nr:hypothetical protein PR202_ga09216 [Eleusine coracana subsp. coracana]
MSWNMGPPPGPAAPGSAAEAQHALSSSPGGGDASFDTNMVIILAALLFALLFALGLNSLVRCLLRWARRGSPPAGEAAGRNAGGSGGGIKKRALRGIPVEVYGACGADGVPRWPPTCAPSASASSPTARRCACSRAARTASTCAASTRGSPRTTRAPPAAAPCSTARRRGQRQTPPLPPSPPLPPLGKANGWGARWLSRLPLDDEDGRRGPRRDISWLPTWAPRGTHTTACFVLVLVCLEQSTLQVLPHYLVGLLYYFAAASSSQLSCSCLYILQLKF